MPYEVEFRPEAIDDLRRLDKAVAQRILRRLRWLSENFESLIPEELTADWKGLFKLRVGSYRVIYTVSQAKHLVTVHLVGHCRDIYKRQ